MSYQPGSTPTDPKFLPEYIQRELQRVSNELRPDAPTVQYLTAPANATSMTAGVSANWKIPNANIIRISASNTLTLTGIADKTPLRVRKLVNVGTGVVVLKSEGTESSSSYRFALSTAMLQLSQNATTSLWYDPYSARHRVL